MKKYAIKIKYRSYETGHHIFSNFLILQNRYNPRGQITSPLSRRNIITIYDHVFLINTKLLARIYYKRFLETFQHSMIKYRIIKVKVRDK